MKTMNELRDELVDSYKFKYLNPISAPDIKLISITDFSGHYKAGFDSAIKATQERVKPLLDALEKHLDYATEMRGDWSDYDGRSHLAIAEMINQAALEKYRKSMEQE